MQCNPSATPVAEERLARARDAARADVGASGAALHAHVAADGPHGGAGVPNEAPGAGRAWLEVDLAALARNARRVAERAGVPILPMVKADAYGLGAVPVARALEPIAPWGYGVACVAEGEALREAGIARPIVVVTPLLGEELDRARRAGLTPTLHRADDVRRWAALGGGAWHLSVDTGMSRAGLHWNALDETLLAAVAACPPEGAFTHFHSAERDAESRAVQVERFRAVVARLPARPRLLHVENGPGVEHGDGASAWDLVRPGIFVYGVGTAGALSADPVAHLRARVVDLRDLAPGETVSYDATWTAPGPRRIATVAAGYADGYRRGLSNRGVALLHGREVPVAGLVTMDMTMLDVTGVPCAVGDVVTLLGRDGDRLLGVADVAARAGLSPYEFLTGLKLRVPRRHLGAPAA